VGYMPKPPAMKASIMVVPPNSDIPLLRHRRAN
jgi:hypothetical protein